MRVVLYLNLHQYMTVHKYYCLKLLLFEYFLSTDLLLVLVPVVGLFLSFLCLQEN